MISKLNHMKQDARRRNTGGRLDSEVRDYFHIGASRPDFAGKDVRYVFWRLYREFPAYWTAMRGKPYAGDPPLPSEQWAYRSFGIAHLIEEVRELDRPFSIGEAVRQEVLPPDPQLIRIAQDLAVYNIVMRGRRMTVREAKWLPFSVGVAEWQPDRGDFAYDLWMNHLRCQTLEYASFERMAKSVPDEDGIDTSMFDFNTTSWVFQEFLISKDLEDSAEIDISGSIRRAMSREGLLPVGSLTDQSEAMHRSDPGHRFYSFEELCFIEAVSLANAGALPIPTLWSNGSQSFLNPPFQALILELREPIGAGDARREDLAPEPSQELVLAAAKKLVGTESESGIDQGAN
jgi:hypothetical protein